jgi:hypothetical protein
MPFIATKSTARRCDESRPVSVQWEPRASSKLRLAHGCAIAAAYWPTAGGHVRIVERSPPFRQGLQERRRFWLALARLARRGYPHYVSYESSDLPKF